ncbi:cold-shock protein [Parafrankia discariae]|uniref:cold-shock protein n=1 Tax=Parafrankia discariae TaxID=365528 RepID=UPI00389946C7
MMMLRGARLVAAVVPLVLTAAACAGAATDARDSIVGGGPVGDSADTAALRVDLVGGFVTPKMLATRLPTVAVYPDGRVLGEGPQAAIYPGPALPNLQLRRISAADVRELVDRAVAAGVGAEPDFGQPPVADVPSTRFTVRTADGVETMQVEALFEADGHGLTARQQSARRAAQELFTALTDLPAALGSGAVSGAEPYTPAAVAAIVAPWAGDCPAPADSIAPADGTARIAPTDGVVVDGPCGGGPAEVERAWPGPALPGEPVGGGVDLSCVTASGDDATKLLAAARTAVTNTRWTSNGRHWNVGFRPLLPGESGCADLWPPTGQVTSGTPDGSGGTPQRPAPRNSIATRDGSGHPSAMATGTVKFFDAEQGWGVVSSPDLPPGLDAWVHFSSIEMDGYRALEAGDRVEFDYEQGEQDGYSYRVTRVRKL